MWYYIEGVFALAMINVISIVGLSVFTGFTGLFSLGHAAFIGIGAYTAAISTYFYDIPFYIAIILGGLMSGFISLLIGYPTLRAKLRSDYFAIATLGFGEAVRVILENLSITQGARGLPGLRAYSTFWTVMVIALIVIILARNFLLSRYGRMAVAVREDFVAAEMMGIDLFKVRLRSLFFSAVCAGVGGSLFAHYITFIQPNMFAGVQSTLLTAAVVAGGMGSITGPIIAALVFAAIPEVLRIANMWRLVAYGFVLVSIMVFRPQGIFGYKELSWNTFRFLFRRSKSVISKGGAR
jgi:branched-chain amino acid transport system permease protein